MKTHAIDTILDLLPLSPGQFGGSEFPLPIKTAYMASESLDIAVLRKQLEAKVNGDVKQLLDPLLLAAEAIESVAPDRDKFFVSDGLLQGYVFMGSKWRAGWACVLGGGDNAALYDELRKRDFMLFTDQPNVADSWYLGYRSTSPIYFLQMMVRYGMIWGRIKPGDDHQMGHFLETDLPGLLILREGMDPLKYLIALGMMKLGAPALVPSSFPFPYGNRVVADTNAEILDRMNGFANLRRKYVGTEVLSLPEYANPAFANEEFDPVWILGNDDNSFFCVLSAGTLSFPDPAPADGDTAIGIAVEVNESEFTDDIGSVVENAALRSLNFLHHERANVTKGIFSLELGGEAAASQSQWEETVRSGIRLNYPGIRNLTIHFYRNTTDVQLLGKQVRQYQGARRAAMDAMTEENTTQFCVCTECRPFSLVHTCILTPDRMPMCASRTYFSVKAGHYFGSGDVPYKRQSESLVPLRKVFDRGRIIDASRGEYEGVNAMYKEMTH